MSTLRVEALEQPDGTAFVFNNKNLLINGGMNLWQRATSATASSTGYKAVDRFQYSQNGSGAYTQSRSTDVPSGQGFAYSMKMDVTTALASPAAANYSMFMQKIEGQNLQHLLKGTSSAKKLTLSFWVKSNKTGTYHARLSDFDNSRHTSKSYTIDSSNTWQKIEITYDGDTTGALDNDSNSSLELQFFLSGGTSYTSGVLATSWEASDNANVAPGQVNLLDSTSNEFYITGIQLEVGSTASGFEFEPFETTQRKCQRYFIMMGGEAIYERFGVGVCRSATQAFISIHNIVRMRGAPTATINAAGDFQLHDGVFSRTVSSIQMDLPSSYITHIIVNTSSSSAGRGAQLLADNTTAARLSLNAEIN